MLLRSVVRLLGPSAGEQPVIAPTLLLIEPDPRFGAVLHQYLADRGWQVEWERVVRDALDLVQRVRPEIILAQVHTPGLDATQLAASVTAAPQRPSVVLCYWWFARLSSWPPNVLDALDVAATIVYPAKLDSIAATLEVELRLRSRWPAPSGLARTSPDD